MKLIDAIKSSKAFRSKELSFDGSCSIVGNSGILLNSQFGNLIDQSDYVMRFNGAKTDSFVESVGQKTNIRILNCHYILNIDSKSYYNHQKNRFPEMDRFFLHSLKGENLIFKTDPSWELWRKKEILKKVENDNEIFFISKEFYELGKKINNGSEPTNGFTGLMLGLKFFNDIKCFGFSFYDDDAPKHYYETLNCDPKNNHNFNKEKKIFNLLNDAKFIKLFR